MRQLHDEIDQRRRFVARIVGTVAEENPRAAQTPFGARDEFACSVSFLRVE